MKNQVEQFFDIGGHSIIKKKDVPAIVETLREVKRKNRGRLTPRTTLAAAKADPKGLLASYVLKDKPKDAAEKWYLQQASEVITSVYTYIVVNGKKMPPVRWVTNIVEKRPDKPGVSYNYVETLPAMQDDRYREQMINEAIAGAQAWERKYRNLMAYSKVVRKIGNVILQATQPVV